MSQVRTNRGSAVLMIQTLLVVFGQLVAVGQLTAQVTVTNTGSTGSSGIQMTNGVSIGASSTQVSIWADSGSTRGFLYNGGFTTGGIPIAVWPCTAPLAANLGGIVYGVLGTTGTNGYQKETCLPGNTSGTAVLSEAVGIGSPCNTTYGVPAPSSGTGSCQYAAAITAAHGPH